VRWNVPTPLKGIARGVDQAAMALLGPLRRRMLLLARSEHGMALPTALFAMIASFALASAAVLSSVDAQQGTKRDHESKEAIAAADAGANLALLRLNRFKSSLKTSPCVGPNGESQLPTGGWCPATPAESVSGATFSYRVSEYKKGSELSVVAVGVAGTVSRRVDVGLIASDEENVFANEGLIGQDTIGLEGTAVEIKTNIGTNGEVTSNGHGTICGSIRHGIGKKIPLGQPQCGGKVSEGEKSLPPISLPENIAAENSNCRLVPNCPSPTNPKVIDPTQVDTYTKSRNSKNPWEASATTINVGGNATLTLTGGDYFVCGLFVDSGQLIMAAQRHVRIFVRTPEECHLDPSKSQVEMKGNASIESTGFLTGEANYAVPEIYVLGPSPVKLTGNAGADELLLYAPYSEVELGGSATWIGLLAGKSMRLHGSPKMEKYTGPAPEDLTISTLWERTHYVECTGVSASSPNASC
jgi:hypothetical protein